MKQKIVIKVNINCEKCQKKALQAAAGKDGVTFVGIEGEAKVVVIGESVDSVELAKAMRKKMGYAAIISVAPA